MNDVYKVAAWIPASGEMIADASAFRAAREAAIDRRVHPWRYPDPAAISAIDPLPGLTRIAAAAGRVRQRVADVVYVARYGMPEPDDP